MLNLTYTYLYIYKYVYIFVEINLTIIMKNKAGAPVTGKDFYGRDNEIEFVWSLITDDNNIILPSPRRIGKTSFAHKMLEKAASNGWKTIDINMERYNLGEFLEELVQKLTTLSTSKKLKRAGNDLIKSIRNVKVNFEYEGFKVTPEWKSTQKDIYHQINNLLDHATPTLIFLDEVTVLLTQSMKKGIEKEVIADFLHWLRSVRIEKDSKIKWIYCSSVGIENFLHTYNISETFNDTHDYELKDFDHETSFKMLKKLNTSTKSGLSDDLLRKVVRKIDFCIPFFLQTIFSAIRSLNSTEKSLSDSELIDAAYQKIIDGKQFNTWIERIKEQYGSLEKSALLVLKHISKSKEGSKRKNLLQQINQSMGDNDPQKAEDELVQVLRMLLNDGYLLKKEKNYLFRSPLIRDFWNNRFVK